ncbi:hypothetical protein B005_3792 [Nocardiopsis alba ATCC BAA-2165]|uniref:Uncharacterized protein n=1 Tax=Nocardiopsis alba (strain ATCC BAA-2165 / BE74) TaxID=1205910 RepID=J7L4J0_NOCAA|nr:hypothetical protein B005_3792 [Nocardiopsis alba ATCC BAA-2165]
MFRSHYRWHEWRLTGAEDRSVISTPVPSAFPASGPVPGRPGYRRGGGPVWIGVRW